jgi:hypothetical protein
VRAGELRWGLGKGLESLGVMGTHRAGSSPSAPMVDRSYDVHARGKERGVIGPAARIGGFARASCPQGRRHRRRGGWRRAARAGLRPRGTGLTAGGVSRPVGTQCSRSPTSDQWSQACSGVHTRWYGGEADVACRGTPSHVGSPRLKTFRCGRV